MVKNAYLNELWEALENIELTCSGLEIIGYDDILERVIRCFNDKKESVIYFIGNGGSAAIASHMSVDFMKNGGMNTCNLFDSSVLTCLGNDYGYEHVFSKQIKKLLKAGDLLVAISSSGNSQNIVNAIQAAKDKNATVMTFTGL